MAKILIADDSAFMRTVLKNILKKAGYDDVIEAGDGEEALSKYEEEGPNLMLLDIVMPKLDGIGVLKKINKDNVNVVIISAVGQKAMMEEAKLYGAKDFIIKPFDAQIVTDVVKRYTES